MGRTRQKKENRTRGPNFSAEETDKLVGLILRHQIVLSKQTDAVTTKQKNDGWQKILDAFNSQYPVRICLWVCMVVHCEFICYCFYIRSLFISAVVFSSVMIDAFCRSIAR